ncbi:MAG: 4a-hydroxytetrahydrobiopterin dehydratase [Chloroflexi bacterium]|nr:4a-hydroxytetrahydrobiopterin dehydratase [Chloroflexota bacterium]
MSKLSETEVAEMLAALTDWELDPESGAIVRHLEFPTFIDAIQFVNRVAQDADDHDHHPDIDIRYRRLKVALISHDVGGLTKRDSRMARLVDEQVKRASM